jgi:hypothetical protein
MASLEVQTSLGHDVVFGNVNNRKSCENKAVDRHRVELFAR